MPNFVEIGPNAAAISRFFNFSRWRPSAILDFSKVGNFNCPYPSEGHNASSCQISRRSVELFRRYGLFSIIKDGGRRHHRFWKFQIFNGWDTRDSRSAAVCQILSKSLKTRLRYGDFSIFQDGGRRHLGFWKFKIFNGWGGLEGRTASSCQISSKSVKPRPKYGYFSFSRWRPPPSWIFEFLNF